MISLPPLYLSLSHFYMQAFGFSVVGAHTHFSSAKCERHSCSTCRVEYWLPRMSAYIGSEYTKSDGLLWKQMAKINDDKTKINTRKTQQTNKHSTQSLFRYFENIPQFVSCINVKCAFLKMPHIHDVEAMLSLRQLYGKLYQWDPFITLKTFVDAGCVSFAIVRISNMLLHTHTVARQYPLEFLLAKIISCCVSLKSNNYLIESSITRTIDFIGSD